MVAHPALTTPEIIRELVEQLSRSTVKTRIRRHILFSTAQVCKAFAKPSLNFLWSEMTSLMPLLRLIPGFEDNDDHRDFVRFQTNPHNNGNILNDIYRY